MDRTNLIGNYSQQFMSPTQGESRENFFEQDICWEEKQYLSQIEMDDPNAKNIGIKQTIFGEKNINEKITHVYSYKNLENIGHEMDEKDDSTLQCASIKLNYQNSRTHSTIDLKKFKNIFKRKENDLGKNTNVAKCFIRELIRNFGKQEIDQFNDKPYILSEVRNFIINEKKMYKDEGNKKNWNNNLASLNGTLGIIPLISKKCTQLPADKHLEYSKLKSFMMRKIAHKMIRDKLIPGIFQSSQIKGNGNLKTYIYTLKVEMLRCRNAQLIERTEIV